MCECAEASRETGRQRGREKRAEKRGEIGYLSACLAGLLDVRAAHTTTAVDRRTELFVQTSVEVHQVGLPVTAIALSRDSAEVGGGKAGGLGDGVTLYTKGVQHHGR
jgi:hypothetical protein